ncbi:hypothetical protein EON65_31970 [archaeon]|nr:MAG: hypothetical protein EON65_31970 [archaeon]
MYVVCKQSYPYHIQARAYMSHALCTLFVIILYLLFSCAQLAKKSYVQLQTTHGNLNIEVYTDMAMCTAWNFLMLCKRSYYDNTVFHRLIPSFVLQGGDPTGKLCDIHLVCILSLNGRLT